MLREVTLNTYTAKRRDVLYLYTAKRRDVFRNASPVSRNTVPRAIFPITLPREQGVYWTKKERFTCFLLLFQPYFVYLWCLLYLLTCFPNLLAKAPGSFYLLRLLHLYNKQELTIPNERDPVLFTSLGGYDFARLCDSIHLQFLVHHLLLNCCKWIKL